MRCSGLCNGDEGGNRMNGDCRERQGEGMERELMGNFGYGLQGTLGCCLFAIKRRTGNKCGKRNKVDSQRQESPPDTMHQKQRQKARKRYHYKATMQNITTPITTTDSHSKAPIPNHIPNTHRDDTTTTQYHHVATMFEQLRYSVTKSQNLQPEHVQMRSQASPVPRNPV